MDIKRLYHEKQSLSLCGLHTANNLLQRKQFTKAQFNTICTDLDTQARADGRTSLINPFKSPFGTGNFHINVLNLALQSAGYTLLWHDIRKPLHSILFKSPALFGVIVNISTASFSFTNSRHWFGLRSFDDLKTSPQQTQASNNNNHNSSSSTWVNLDSRLSTPAQLTVDIQTFLQQQVDTARWGKETQIILVAKQDTDRAALYD
jgi:josephin